MTEFTFQHALVPSIKVVIEAKTFGEAYFLLKAITTHADAEDYFCTNDKQKVLS